jgi:tetratricopeptide (TPR) repeat protein
LATYDPQFRSEARAAEPLSDSERDARIEQLLLAGLDEYFSGQYEHAINLWTRVLFLDRHHDRARAYIERARSAQAERLRESEAVLQQGVDLFHQGDVQGARRLIADALDRGASREDAQGLLDRIERLGAGSAAPVRRRRASSPAFTVTDEPLPAAPPRRRTGWAAVALLVIAAVGVIVVGFLGITPLDLSAWAPLSSSAAPSVSALSVATPGPLPVVSASEAVLARARALAATGRLHDAVHELDRIQLGDPLTPDADALRARVQRELLAVAAAETAPPSPAAGTPPE